MMITGYQERLFLVYLGFYLFFIVVGYQYIRAQKPYLSGLIGLIAIAGIVVLYTIGKLFFPQSPFTPTFLPPAGLLLCIYYLTYPRNRRIRSRILTVFVIIYIIVLTSAYFISAVNF